MARLMLETEEEIETARYKLCEPDNDDKTKQWASLIWLEAWKAVAVASRRSNLATRRSFGTQRKGSNDAESSVRGSMDG
jgi:hypothetical protein